MSTNMLNAAVKSLNERGDWRHALKLLHQIVVNYPDSEEARKAQVMIDKLADEGKELSPAQENAISSEQSRTAETTPDKPQIESKYGTARGVASFIAFTGWLAVIAGFITVLASASNDLGAVGYLSGFFVSFTGLLSIMGAQVVKATVDTADHTRAILAELSSRK